MNLFKRREPSNTNSVIRQFGNSVIVPNSVIRQFGNSVIRKTRQGFTIIELLVASLLLGMLMTILTMIFNQSSIAWRTGMAGTIAMDAVRENIAEVREEADNAFGWGNTLYRITGVWGKDGQLRKRACDAPGSGSDESESHAELLRSLIGSQMANLRQRDIQLTPQWQSGGSGSGQKGMQGGGGGGKKTYTVNVMSAGPDRQFDTWDDVWSWPDDFE